MRIWMPTIATGTGAEVYVRRLAEGLVARGHCVDLDVVAHRYQYAPWLAGIAPCAGTDVILANSWSAAAFAGPAPLVTVLHHVVHDPALAGHKTHLQALFHRGFVKPMELAAIRRSTRIVAVSETSAASVRAHLADVPLQVVLNGIDTEFFQPGESAPQADPARPMNLLFVGKPSRRKAFDTVAAIVERMGADCRFTCVGPEPEPGLRLPHGDYRGRVSREDLREAYRAADVLLMPSHLEGFGYAAAEALACGLPVACVAGGAVAEVVDPPRCGLAVAGGDADAFVAGLRAIRAAPESHRAMRAAARQRAVQHLDEARWIDGMERVLAEAARARP